tara:strand:+ start:11152 stop:11451 length:300 start_codon:yes stop_codon:yes gene_type:complete
MSNTEDQAINNLFFKLESEVKASENFNFKSLYSENPCVSREAYGWVFAETLVEIAKIQKQIVRAFLRAGEIGELIGHIECGTLPKYSIQAALGRNLQTN